MQDEIAKHKWCDNGNGYLVARINGRKQYLHRIIAGAKPGEIVDHINRDRRDNRPENLRIVSYSESIHNKAPKPNKLGVRGVYFHRKARKYCAEIRKDNRRHYLGLFDTIKEAEKAYLIKKGELYGSQ